MPFTEPACTALARMAACAGDGDLAFATAKEGVCKGLQPKLRSFVPALVAFCEAGRIDEAFEVRFCKVPLLGFGTFWVLIRAWRFLWSLVRVLGFARWVKCGDISASARVPFAMLVASTTLSRGDCLVSL